MSEHVDYNSAAYTRCFVPEADGGYSCYAKELHGCMSQGNSLAEAYENLDNAIHNWCQAARSQGQVVPLPDPDFWSRTKGDE
jgi:antitoxin HicB